MDSIEDFPPEIMELFKPDLKPKTINNLKLVSKRFYSVFSADRFFESFLHHPEKEHKTLMRSECKDDSVQEVAEIIRKEELGRWRGWLELEKVHYSNCKNGRLESFEDLHFPFMGDYPLPTGSTRVDELIDEDLEHWIIFSVQHSGSRIRLFNVTAKPTLTFSKDLKSSDVVARVLPGQLVMADNCRGLFDVYNVVGSSEGFSVVFKWGIVPSADKSEPRSSLGKGEHGDSTPWTSAIISGKVGTERCSVLVASQNSLQSPVRGSVLVWNLKTGKKTVLVDFVDRETWCEIWTASSDLMYVTSYPSEFPYVMVEFTGPQGVSVTLFNVLSTDVTLMDRFLRPPRSSVLYAFSRRFIVLLVVDYVWHNSFYTTGNTYHVILYHVDASGECCKLLRESRDDSTSVMVLNDRVLVTFQIVQPDCRWEVSVYRLEGASAALERTFSIANLGTSSFIAFVDPDLLVFATWHGEWIVHNLKGDKLCSRKRIGRLKRPNQASGRLLAARHRLPTMNSCLYLVFFSLRKGKIVPGSTIFNQEQR